MEAELHQLARDYAADLRDPDKKQLRFNEIVAVAMSHYPAEPREGVRELVVACDRANADLYDKSSPMWKSLRENYRWMTNGV